MATLVDGVVGTMMVGYWWECLMTMGQSFSPSRKTLIKKSFLSIDISLKMLWSVENGKNNKYDSYDNDKRTNRRGGKTKKAIDLSEVGWEGVESRDENNDDGGRKKKNVFLSTNNENE